MNKMHMFFCQSLQHALLALTAFCTSAWGAAAHHCAPTTGPSHWQGVVTHYGFVNRPLGPFEPKQLAGVNTIRDEVFWDQVQRADGSFHIPQRIDALVDEALRHHITPMLVLGYGHPAHDQGGKPRSAQALEGFRRYAVHVAKHFQGRVRHFEIWNEWDADIGGGAAGDPDSYVRLVQQVAPALRALDPDLCLVVGALTPAAQFNGWLNKALAQGLLKHADALSLHTYNYAEGRGKDTPDSWHRDLQWFIDKELPQHPFTRGKSVLVSEMGWANHQTGVSENLQAAYALRLRLLSLALAHQTAHTANPYLGHWWYDWQDDGDDPQEMEHRYGLTRRSGLPKAAWTALKELETLLPTQGTPSRYKTAHIGSEGALTTLTVNMDVSTPHQPTLLAIWHPANEQAQVSVLLHDEAPRFSAACEAQKMTPQKWRITASAMPCLIQLKQPLRGQRPVWETRML